MPRSRGTRSNLLARRIYLKQPESLRASAGFEGDVRDLEHLKRKMADTQPEVVFHLAAQPLVRQSYTHPVDTFATNVMGTVNVLEAVRSTPSVRVGVIVTSDKCYENREWVWGYRETDVLGGYDPYSASKGAAEIVTSAYRHSFFPLEKYAEHRVAVASVRAGNVIGGGDWSMERLLPRYRSGVPQGRISPDPFPQGDASMAARPRCAARVHDARRADVV